MNLTYDCPIQLLPFANIENVESIKILKKLTQAHRFLAELKGVVVSIPNQNILINTLSLQEAKHSSEIENIITTQDEIYKSELNTDATINPAAKEVKSYNSALHYGFEKVKKEELIRLDTLLGVQKLLEKNKAGLRALPGTELKNAKTGQVVFTPPQNKYDIEILMDNLITFINDDDMAIDVDPLVKMAIIHYQFESIHPFYDGNGRTGRILNILYLVQKELLDIPILYLSRYLIENKAEYYALLQSVRNKDDWESWILYMLDAVIETSKSTLILITKIKELMADFKKTIKTELPKIYKQELLNNLFKHPYTKIEFVQDDLNVSWHTAKSYLEQLTEIGLLKKEKISRYNYYINEPLFNLFVNH